MNNIINEIYTIMSKQFWLYFLRDEFIELSQLQNLNELTPEDINGFEDFKNAVDGFYKLITSYYITINRLQLLYEDNKIDLLNNYHIRICALFYSKLPSNYNNVIYHFYKIPLRIITKGILYYSSM